MTKVILISHCDDCPYHIRKPVYGIDDVYYSSCGHSDVINGDNEPIVKKMKSYQEPFPHCPLSDLSDYES